MINYPALSTTLFATAIRFYFARLLESSKIKDDANGGGSITVNARNYRAFGRKYSEISNAAPE